MIHKLFYVFIPLFFFSVGVLAEETPTPTCEYEVLNPTPAATFSVHQPTETSEQSTLIESRENWNKYWTSLGGPVSIFRDPADGTWVVQKTTKKIPDAPTSFNHQKAVLCFVGKGLVNRICYTESEVLLYVTYSSGGMYRPPTPSQLWGLTTLQCYLVRKTKLPIRVISRHLKMS